MLDFTQRPKKYLNVKFANGDTLMVSMPRKKTFEKMTSINLNNEDSKELLNDLYLLVAEILSNNKQGKVITADYVDDALDIDDVKALFAAYSDFVHGVTSDPN